MNSTRQQEEDDCDGKSSSRHRRHEKKKKRRKMMDVEQQQQQQQRQAIREDNDEHNETRTDKASAAANTTSNTNKITTGICSNVSTKYEKIGTRVGEGTYGVVYQARNKHMDDPINNTHRTVALKRCIPHHEKTDGFPLTTLREIRALKICCQHPNIVTLLEIAVSTNTKSTKSCSSSSGNNNNVFHSGVDSSGGGGVFLVFEYCPKDIGQILDDHYYAKSRASHGHSNQRRQQHRQQQPLGTTTTPFTESQVKTLLQQLLSAIQCCHDHYLIHRDIKPSNLLYTNEGVLKVCDFGLSRHCSGRDRDDEEPPLTPNVVSLWYRAPELLFKKKAVSSDNTYSFPIDLFAVGCVFAELLQGIPLLDGKSEIDQIYLMVSCLGQPPTRIYEYRNEQSTKSKSSSHTSNLGLWDQFDYLSAEGLTLLTRLLEYNPNERWTAKQAIQSKYFMTNPLPTTKMPKF